MFSVEFDANIALSIWWFQAATSLQTAMFIAYSGTFLLPTSWGMPNIGRTETEAMLAGVGRNHPNDHFLQIPRVDNVARCYVCELVPGLNNAMLDFTGVLYIYIYIYIYINQRKLGSNTSELRINRILRLEMMKGGMSSNNT